MSDDKLKETQEVPPITAADVLEVFGHFQDGVLAKIDERDRNVVRLLQNIVSDLLSENRRIMQRGDDHEKRISANSRDIEDLRKKQNEMTSEITAIKLKLERMKPKP